MTFVDRLEDELIRAGYSRPRHRRAPAVAGVVALVCASAVLAFALRTNASPGPAKPEHRCPGAARTNESVDPRLLQLARRPAHDGPSRPVQSRCAEAKVGAGPVYADGARYVGPGPLGGSVFMVPMLHWSSDEGAPSPKARAWRRLPGACTGDGRRAAVRRGVAVRVGARDPAGRRVRRVRRADRGPAGRRPARTAASRRPGRSCG